MPKKCVLLAVAPLYEQPIWFEQILDYLSENQESIVLMPKITTAQGVEVETNLIYDVLKNQVENIEYYEIILDVNSQVYQPMMLENHKQAAEKMCQYIQFENGIVTLKEVNKDVNYLLAKQYDVFLDDMLKKDYHVMQEQLLVSLIEKVESLEAKDIIVFADIEHAFLTRIKLKSNLEIDLSVYGTCDEGE